MALGGTLSRNSASSLVSSWRPSVGEVGQLPRPRPGRHHDVAGLERHLLGAVVPDDADVPGAVDAAAPVDGRGLRLAQQALDAAVQRLHHLVAPAGGDAVVEAHLPGVDAETVTVAHLVEQRGALQQRLGGDAAAMQARPAHLLCLDDGCAETELPGADGGDVAAGAPAQEHHVVALWHAPEYRSAHPRPSPFRPPPPWR